MPGRRGEGFIWRGTEALLFPVLEDTVGNSIRPVSIAEFSAFLRILIVNLGAKSGTREIECVGSRSRLTESAFPARDEELFGT